MLRHQPIRSSHHLLERRPGVALAVFGAFLSYACGGCLSNAYVIPKAELVRLANLPPQERGRNVAVVQELGERRGEAIDTSQPPAPVYQEGPDYGPPPAGYVEEGPQTAVGVGVIIVPGGSGGPPVGRAGRPMPGPRGPVGGPVRAPGAGTRPSTGSRGSNLGKGGGGGNNNEVVVLLVVMAVLATVGMVATEGVRYDGNVAMYVWQPLHLKSSNGQEREVPLAQLTPQDAADATQAVVMDDEGWGITRFGRRPLDRQGFAFKMDSGLFHSSCACLAADGAAANIQLGFFPSHRFGLLADWSPAGGSDSDGKSFYRHDLALEAQFFPVTAGRLNLGVFGHGGIVYVSDALGGFRDGAAFGGGLLLELALTTRLALTFRADYTSAKVAPAASGRDWAAAETFAVGVAVY